MGLQARAAADEIVKRIKADTNTALFGAFVEGPFFDFYSRKWKESSAETTKQRIRTHLVSAFKDRELSSFKRDELQDLLDAKSADIKGGAIIDHETPDKRRFAAVQK